LVKNEEGIKEKLEDITGQFHESKEPAIAGTIVLTPIIATILIISWILGWIDQLPASQIFQITEIYYLNQAIKLFSILILGALAVTITGRVVKTNIGFRLEKIFDRIVQKLPFIGKLYKIVKVSTDTILTGTDEFREPVKLDFNGLRVTAYKTGNTTDDDREIIFLPTSPNITTGFVIEAEQEKLEEVDETVEEALTRTLSAGFATGEQKDTENTDNENN